MTYAIAHAKLVSLFETTVTSTDIATSASTSFAHLPELASDQPDKSVRSRSFAIEGAVDGDGTGDYPYTPDIAGQPRMHTRMTATVYYREVRGKRQDLDRQINVDGQTLWKRLATPSNFNPRTTTNIDYVDAITWRRIPLPSGDAQLKITFDMHWL